MIAATELGETAMIDWCTRELSGYDHIPKDHEYRVLIGRFVAEDVHGRTIPVKLSTPAEDEAASRLGVGMPIGDIDAALGEMRAGKNVVYQFFFTSEVEAKLMQGMDKDVVRLYRVVQALQFGRVVEAVKNKAFLWALENRGSGSGSGRDADYVTPAAHERGAAEVLGGMNVQAETYVAVYGAPNSPIQIGKGKQQQETVYGALDVDAVGRLVERLEADLSSRETRAVKEIRDEMGALRAILQAPTPRPSWLRESLGTIRRVLESAAGEVLADAAKAGGYIAEIGRMLGA